MNLNGSTGPLETFCKPNGRNDENELPFATFDKSIRKAKLNMRVIREHRKSTNLKSKYALNLGKFTRKVSPNKGKQLQKLYLYSPHIN